MYNSMDNKQTVPVKIDTLVPVSFYDSVIFNLANKEKKKSILYGYGFNWHNFLFSL